MYLIAAMIKDSEKIIMIKTAITLRILLNQNKNSLQLVVGKIDIVTSYEKIAVNSSSDLTKATVNNAFSGIKRSTMPTIILIVETMGFNMKDFGDKYDKITDRDIEEFKKHIIKNKS